MDGGVDDDMKTKLKQCAGMYLGGQEVRGLDVRLVESLDIRAKSSTFISLILFLTVVWLARLFHLIAGALRAGKGRPFSFAPRAFKWDGLANRLL